MKVRYSSGAQPDLEAISAYLRIRSPHAADVVIATLEARILKLADFPFAGPQTDEPGLRELTVVRYPYKIYYRVAGDDIWIVHVRDARRQPYLDEIS